MPIFSLPSDFGIGTFGKEAYNFVDFLKEAGQTYWQVLPLGVTGFGDSPYQSVSSFAGNPYFIDPVMLCNAGYLTRSEIEAFDFGSDSGLVDYEKLYNSRYKMLEIAFGRFKEKSCDIKDYQDFLEENNYWLKGYALYSAIKEHHGGASFDCFESGYKFRLPEAIKRAETELAERIDFYKFIQYHFFRQWEALKSYANEQGIKIIGDIPIYVAFDSADVWSDPKQFQLDENLMPKAVAGCPPDAFSEDGQLWGNPLYDWDYMKNDGYSWWINRIAFCSKLYDVVRIDHFRAFSAYFSIPAGDETAVDGHWKKGPGIKLFKALESKLGKLNIVAEDLGTIDDDVRELLKNTGFPGMKVLQFAFDPEGESSYLPHNIGENCVCYTGTHDNDTAVGFLKDGPQEQVRYMKEYLRIEGDDGFNWALIKAAMATSADTVILQMQDFLGLDNAARINTPATSGGNWCWRIGKSCINSWLAKIIYDTTHTYRRLPKTDDENT